MCCSGLVLKLRVKKDVSTVKLLGLACQSNQQKESSLVTFDLDDFQLLH